jgi:hypothetical protein
MQDEQGNQPVRAGEELPIVAPGEGQFVASDGTTSGVIGGAPAYDAATPEVSMQPQQDVVEEKAPQSPEFFAAPEGDGELPSALGTQEVSVHASEEPAKAYMHDEGTTPPVIAAENNEDNHETREITLPTAEAAAGEGEPADDLSHTTYAEAENGAGFVAPPTIGELPVDHSADVDQTPRAAEEQ